MPSKHAGAFKKHIGMAMEGFVAALSHIPDDKLDWAPMGKAKPALAIAVEIETSNKWLAAELRGEEGAGAVWETMDPSSCPTREAATAALRESLVELETALDEATDEVFGETRELPWGQSTVAEMCGMGAIHIAYHSGQLNYIQLLLGDEEFHME